jgi:hypothetical protein
VPGDEAVEGRVVLEGELPRAGVAADGRSLQGRRRASAAAARRLLRFEGGGGGGAAGADTQMTPFVGRSGTLVAPSVVRTTKSDDDATVRLVSAAIRRV